MSTIEAIPPESSIGTEAVDVVVDWEGSDIAALAVLLEEATAGATLQLLLMASRSETEWRCRFVPPEPGEGSGAELADLIGRLDAAGIAIVDVVRVARAPPGLCPA